MQPITRREQWVNCCTQCSFVSSNPGFRRPLRDGSAVPVLTPFKWPLPIYPLPDPLPFCQLPILNSISSRSTTFLLQLAPPQHPSLRALLFSPPLLSEAPNALPNAFPVLLQLSHQGSPEQNPGLPSVPAHAAARLLCREEGPQAVAEHLIALGLSSSPPAKNTEQTALWGLRKRMGRDQREKAGQHCREMGQDNSVKLFHRPCCYFSVC